MREELELTVAQESSILHNQIAGRLMRMLLGMKVARLNHCIHRMTSRGNLIGALCR